jgi:hypothetical protein
MYTINKTISNGYRCCCKQTWDDSLEEESYDDAIRYLDKEFLIEKFEKNSECEIVKIEITLNDTLVASAQLEYPIHNKYPANTKYQYSFWRGFVGDEYFEEVYLNNEKINKTLDQVIDELEYQYITNI